MRPSKANPDNWQRLTDAERAQMLDMQAELGLDRAAKMLGTTDITFEKLTDRYVRCKAEVVERVRGTLAAMREQRVAS